MSMKPGATVRPVASIVRAARLSRQPPMAAILPGRMPISPMIRRVAGAVDNASAANQQVEVLGAKRGPRSRKKQEPEFHKGYGTEIAMGATAPGYLAHILNNGYKLLSC